ncbi:tyrosine-type recombinase/integrase [Nibricoccus sp. IMCC34717]|uniref:tyrosine-type recombinase/integrase n=1 Tax=Nibricoccus sp. IMCC34717 TaxID=3034021 RepID=UPI00384A6057
MKSEAQGERQTPRKLVFHRVAENLYRLETSGGYYALLKRGDKQFRRSLKTKDRKLAERRLAELRSQVGNLTISEDANLTFAEVAARWMTVTNHTLKPSSIQRRALGIRMLSPFFGVTTIRHITRQQCERWLTERGPTLAPMSFNRELELMHGVFGYAIRLGLILKDPSEGIERRRVVQAKIQIPSRQEFRDLIAAIRKSDGRKENQDKAQAGADLVELLAYSGCRLNEATSLVWGDVDFKRNTLRITGGEQGTKNHEERSIPMPTALRALLERLRGSRNPNAHERISLHDSAKKCLATACARLGYPHFTHHDFRHLFATTCIEGGVDIPTVSRWLGHKDGGALAMKTYGHLRLEHSLTAISKVQF